MRSIALGCVVLSSLALAAGDARAQEGTPNYPPPGSGTPNYPPPNTPPPSAPPPNGPPGAAPGFTPVAPGGPAAATPGGRPVGAQGDEEPKDEGRIRVGFNLNGGIGTGANFGGVTFGATFRLGYQIDKLMAIYGQVSPFLWLGVNNGKVSGIGGFQFTPMFSLTPVDILELAAGPSIDRLSGGTAGASISTNSVGASGSAFSAFYFAIHGRIALHFGGKPNVKTGRRSGFTLGFDIHPTFAEGSTVTFYTVGLGADWY